MNHQLTSLLVAGGLIGAGYLAFNYLSTDSQKIDLKSARKITQEIKHQILIVAINFSEGSRSAYTKVGQDKKEQREELNNYFRQKMAEIYAQKQKLILDKHKTVESDFAASLKKFAKDSKIMKNQEDILEMMSLAVEGVTPDLTVDHRALNKFSNKQIADLYQSMNKLILIKVISKLQQQKRENPNFDSNNDLSFKNAVKSLNIYDLKVEFFKQNGFQEEWGCPNETFFKISENTKINDADFKAEMSVYEKAYENIIEIAASAPQQIDIENFDAFYNEKVIEIKKQKQVKQHIPQPVVVNYTEEQTKIIGQAQPIEPIEPVVPIVPIVPVQLVVEIVDSVGIETEQISKKEEQEKGQQKKQQIVESVVEGQKDEVEKQIENDVNVNSQQQNKEDPVLVQSAPQLFQNQPIQDQNNAQNNQQSE